MSDKTGIEWTDATWNPVRGCSRVSAGCMNCYAEKVAARFGGPGLPYEGLTAKGKWTGQTRVVEEHMADPLRWQRPRKIFVNSMSDLFHETMSFEDIARIFLVMASAKQHTFQILTKRPERMREFITHGNVLESVMMAGCWPLHNVWLGVSVEDQAAADARIPILLSTPAAVRFLSCEPLIGSVNLTAVGDEPTMMRDVLDEGIDWVIVGGESGAHARPMYQSWARSLRDQCAAYGVPFFFKQWGEHQPDFEGFPIRVGKKTAGKTLDGQQHCAFPEART